MVYRALHTFRVSSPGTQSRSVTKQRRTSQKAHFFTKSNQFVVTVKGAVLPSP